MFTMCFCAFIANIIHHMFMNNVCEYMHNIFNIYTFHYIYYENDNKTK